VVDDEVYHKNTFAIKGGFFYAIDNRREDVVVTRCRRGAEWYIIQQDGAKPHTSYGTFEELKLAGNDGNETMTCFITQSS
jgi:hypothetical protein